MNLQRIILDEKIKNPQKLHGDSLVVQMVKNLTAMWETQLQTLGQQDPLEKGMATHSSILPGEFHGQRSLTGYSPRGGKESDMTELANTM